MRDEPDGQLEIGLEYNNRGKKQTKKNKNKSCHTLMPCETSMSLTFVTGPSWKIQSSPILWVDDWRQRVFCVFPFERPAPVMRLTREIQTVVNHQNSRSFPFFYLRAKHKRLTDLVARDKRRTFSKNNQIKVLVCCFHGQPNTTRNPNVQIPIAGLEGWGICLLQSFCLFYFIFKFSVTCCQTELTCGGLSMIMSPPFSIFGLGW